MKPRHGPRLLACLLACLWSVTISPRLARAQTTASPEAADEAVNLPPFEVVASPLANVSAPDGFATTTTTIDAGQLQELKALDFASALRRTPGVTITRFNQVGAFGGGEGGAVFVRGLGSSRPGGEIKTMVDGVPKMNGIFNHPLLDLMSIDAAGSIEMHPRAMPLELGNTFAAVNIVTPRVEKEGETLRATLAGGSFGTFVERVDAGVRRDAFDGWFSQSLRRSDGHRPDSGGRMQDYLVRLGWTPSSAWSVSYVLNHTDNRATDPGVDGAAVGPPSTRGDRYETKDWFHVATLSHLTGPFEGTIRAYLNDGDGNWLRRDTSANADSLNSWHNYGVRWRETVRPWEGGTIVAGADFDANRGTTISRPPDPAPQALVGPVSMRLISGYAGLSQTFRWDRLQVTPSAGARFYDHSEFGSEGAGQAGITVAAGDTQFHASYGRAVNHPGLEVVAFSRMIIPALGESWRSLKPEVADQFQVGLRHAFSRTAALSVTFFRNDVRDRYVIVFPPPPPPRYQNLETYRTEGVEITGEAAWSERVGVFAGLSLMRVEPDDVPYAPKTSFTTGVNWRVASGWHLSMDATYTSSMHQASAARAVGAQNSTTIGAQFLLNARLSRRLAIGANQEWLAELYLAGENLTDRDFAYQPGYPIPGINFMLGIRLQR